jgi:hypothetical protein
MHPRETTRVHPRCSSDNGHDLIAVQMNQTPPVWLPPEVADKVFGNVEIAVQDPGVVSNRAGPSTSARIAYTGLCGVCRWSTNSAPSTTPAYACYDCAAASLTVVTRSRRGVSLSTVCGQPEPGCRQGISMIVRMTFSQRNLCEIHVMPHVNTVVSGLNHNRGHAALGGQLAAGLREG